MVQAQIQWTQEQWQTHVRVNGSDSYSLAVLTAALLLAENPGASEERQHSLISDNVRGLSGFQFEVAKKLSLHLWDLAAANKARVLPSGQAITPANPLGPLPDPAPRRRKAVKRG